MKRREWVALAAVVCALVIIVGYFVTRPAPSPNTPSPPPVKDAVITTDYYNLTFSTFVKSLRLGGWEVCEYWKIFQLEENHMMLWKLEDPVKSYCIHRHSGGLHYMTISRLYTYDCLKEWHFFYDQPHFFLKITKIYTQSGWSLNNQIIVDVNHLGVESSVSSNISQLQYSAVPGCWVAFNCVNGVFGFLVVGTNNPDLTIQFPFASHPRNVFGNAPSEVQINFNGKTDRDVGYHVEGEMESVSLLVYAREGGTMGDFLEWVAMQ